RLRRHAVARFRRCRSRRCDRRFPPPRAALRRPRCDRGTHRGCARRRSISLTATEGATPMAITSPTSPESVRRERRPGGPSLILGVIYPAIVVAIELISRMCASAFFDPMPTIWHVLAVNFVPAGNLLVWLHLHNDMRWRARWVAFVNGGAVAI